MKILLTLAALTAVITAAPVRAQDAEKPEMLSPGQIVDQAPAKEWRTIAASDLLIMKLQPDAKGKERKVIIQLMPPPFSQGWIRNIRKLAMANWWDDTRIVRVQDNYVVQWGDPAQEESDRKPLPAGLEVMSEQSYINSFSPNMFLKLWSHRGSRKAEQKIVPVTRTRPGWTGFDDPYANAFSYIGSMPVAMTMKQEYRTVRNDGSRNSQTSLAQDRFSLPESVWPIHCYGAIGVGRNLSPDTGSGAELYTVIGHAPRHLDRNIAVVGRIIEGMHNLSSLPRGFGPLGFYETPEEQVPIQSIRLASELPAAEQPRFEFLSTDGESFAQYANRRANREPPFFIKPAGGADICNIPVPVRREKAAD